MTSSSAIIATGSMAALAETTAVSIATAVAETAVLSRELIARQPEGMRNESRQLGPDGHIINSKLFGVPDYARQVLIGKRNRLLPSDPADTIVFSAGQVFRQYVSTAENLSSILSGRVLLPGPLPFAAMAGGSFYQDLVGAFVTLPRFSPLTAGVPDSLHYVDLQFYAGTGLLRLSPRDGRYFMVPGTPMQREWEYQFYDDWIHAGSPDRKKCLALGWSLIADKVEWYRKVKAQGGFPIPSQIPIRVVKAGKV
ncbi:MAG: hypothetical protein Q8P84_09525 [Deltaproteobacteria bacterium]|nr:hypothetical protein [Deltaproteobacteria bacterium]